ncbi:hypothetical protein M707_21975 [Arthrobacter sp. AK-YN10]|nr:hypothetical protein M707_21975 [Arthrobacter sp. AK-YN10]
MKAAERVWKVTARDEEIIRWIGRWPFVTIEQIEREWKRRQEPISVKVIYRRLLALKTLGLIDVERGWSDTPSAYFLTREGMNLADIIGPVVRPKLAQIKHDMAVVDLADWILRERPTYRLVTEREIRREDTPRDYHSDAARPPRYAIMRRLSAHKTTRFFPDLVTIDPDERMTVHEMEHSPKEIRRLVDLMGSYLQADHVYTVRYYCNERAINHVQLAAHEINTRARQRQWNKKVAVVAWPLPVQPELDLNSDGGNE